jgi:hypothetical protein
MSGEFQDGALNAASSKMEEALLSQKVKWQTLANFLGQTLL